MNPLFIRALWIGLAVLCGIAAALVAAIISRIDGASVVSAIQHGAVTFAATVTLLILLLAAVGLVF